MCRHPVTNTLTKAQLKVAKNLNLNLKNSREMVKLGIVLPCCKLIKECLMTWKDALDSHLNGGEAENNSMHAIEQAHTQKSSFRCSFHVLFCFFLFSNGFSKTVFAVRGKELKGK